MNPEEREFWNRLKRWTLNDIDICLGHNANVGAAKLMCCAIESFGSFYIGRGFNEDERRVRPKGGSGENRASRVGVKNAFVAFVKNYISELNSFILRIEGLGKKNGGELLYDHFRNNLIHEGSPSIGIGIIREEGNRILVRAEGYIALVNLLALRNALERAITSYDGGLNDEAQPERLRRWRDRYNDLKRFKMGGFR